MVTNKYFMLVGKAHIVFVLFENTCSNQGGLFSSICKLKHATASFDFPFQFSGPENKNFHVLLLCRS